MIRKKWLLAVSAGAVLALGVAACGGDDDDSSSDGGDSASGLSGSISIDGSSTVQPFAEAAAELFNEENPDVNVTVGAAGTSGGFEKFCAGETDISDASRSIEPEEEKLCKDGGVEYTEVQVANDGISVVTNPALEISCLTTDQLKQLWDDRRGHQLQRARRRRRLGRGAAGRRGQPLRAGHGLGHVRLLHRRDQR